MRRTLQKAGYCAVLSSLMALAAGTAQADGTAPTLSDIAKQLEALNKRLDTIETSLKVPDGSAFAMKKMQDDLLELKKQIASMEQKVPYTARRVDASKQGVESTVRPQSSTARVKFVNDWVEDVSVVVNGVGYEVLIGSELTVPVPAGPFTYQILNLQRRPITRALEADKLWTVSINTRN